MDELAARAEEACLNGWPSLSTALFDGWLLRFAQGYTKRANSVSVIGPARAADPGALADRIAACRALYAAHGLPTIFRISSVAPQEGLEEALDAAGFGPAEDETRVLVARSPMREPLPGAPARLAVGNADGAWLDALARVSGLDAREATLHGRILAALAVPAAFAAVAADDGATGAVAFGAVHDRIVCVNSVATAPAHRGRGLAGRAVSAVIAWAATEAGAESACLPVGAANAPALALYRRLGFTTEVSRYRYRIAPPR